MIPDTWLKGRKRGGDRGEKREGRRGKGGERGGERRSDCKSCRLVSLLVHALTDLFSQSTTNSFLGKCTPNVVNIFQSLKGMFVANLEIELEVCHT